MPGPADSSCRHMQRSSQYSFMPSFEFFSMIAEMADISILLIIQSFL